MNQASSLMLARELQWFSHGFAPFFLPLLVVFLSVCLCYCLLCLARLILQFHTPLVSLIVIPHRDTSKTMAATAQLLTVIAPDSRGILDYFWPRPRISCELLASQADGIRYRITVPVKREALTRQALLSFLPSCTVSLAASTLPANVFWQTITLDLPEHNSTDQLLPYTEHDPIALVLGMMDQLAPDECVLYQVIITKDRQTQWFIHFLGHLIAAIVGLIPELLFGPAQTKTPHPSTTPSEVITCATSLRISVGTITKHAGQQRMLRLQAALSQLGTTKPKGTFIWQRVLQPSLEKRCFSVFDQPHRHHVPATIAHCYHFPEFVTTQTASLDRSAAKPLPNSSPAHRIEAVTLATNHYHQTETTIGLTEAERQRHVYMIGATGTGKSTMLFDMICQDMLAGRGVAVLDPHGDLVEQLLTQIPADRQKDVIYCNPDDIQYPIGLNLLERQHVADPLEQAREDEYVTESVISLFHKVFPDKYSGPRMEYIVRNAVQTALTVPNATLFTVYDLLTKKSYRSKVVAQLTNPHLQAFWREEFDKAGSMQRMSMIMPITNKLGRFLFSPVARGIIGQPVSTIDFTKVMNQRKILLCNLSKGKLGEDTSALLGITIMTKLQLAVLKRARMVMEHRTDFYLYVDEFQNFATPAFSELLAESRKYHLSVVLAHQTAAQIQDAALEAVTLANVGTVICFRTASPSDEKLLLPFFQPFLTQGDLANLPSFSCYIKRHGVIPLPPCSGKTRLPLSLKGAVSNEAVIALSRQLYGKKPDLFSQNSTAKVIAPID